MIIKFNLKENFVFAEEVLLVLHYAAFFDLHKCQINHIDSRMKQKMNLTVNKNQDKVAFEEAIIYNT